MILVQKRITGNKVEFDKSHISDSIKKALVKTNHDDEGHVSIAYFIADSIENDLINKNCELISVEQIQDLVEEQLVKNFEIDIVREYMTYRDRQSVERLKNTELDEANKSILDSSNNYLVNENANLNARSFAGKMTKFGNENAKWFAKKHLIPSKFLNAHNIGRFHIHDLDNWAVGTHNCLFIDMRPLLKDGFFTGNGSVRGANSVSVAFDLIPIIFQSQQNSQFGGVATAHIDHDLAPYVAKSFRKHFAKAVKYLTYKVDSLLDFMGIDDKRIRPEAIQDHIKKCEKINISNSELKCNFNEYYSYALNETIDEAKQGAQAMIHNLNTMCSRAGKLDCQGLW